MAITICYKEKLETLTDAFRNTAGYEKHQYNEELLYPLKETGKH